MKETLDQKTSRLVRECVQLDADARRQYLDRECGDDDDLRKRVERKIEDYWALGNTEILNGEYVACLPEHYRLVHMIGRGGMSEVYLAEDTRLQRRVAIKFLSRELRSDPERMKRFAQEARAVSALNHPNILIIHDIGNRNGIQFIVTEFVEGETLSSRLNRGAMPVAEAVRVLIGVASALAASHRAGIVHRDIKPDNIMIREDGVVKVLDFGLAKETGGGLRSAVSHDDKTLDGLMTSPGLILGTPQYMSPEQARGAHLDHRTDIFSLGIIAFESVTGKPPFVGSDLPEIIASILAREPLRLEDYLEEPPPMLKMIIDRALKKDRGERYDSMREMLADLEKLRDAVASGSQAPRNTRIAPAKATLQNTIGFGKVRVPYERILTIFLVLALVGGGIWIFFRLRTPGPASRESMKTIAVTSWSSGVGELVSAGSFSPDGRMIAFAAAKSGATEIWVKPTVGGDSIQVTKGGFYNQYPVWSPGGQELAFFSGRGDNRGIWRTSFTGGEQSLILGGVAPTAAPRRWTESGKIYFQEGSELFAVEVATGRRSPVTNFESMQMLPRIVTISPDESKVAFAIRENDLWKLKVKALADEKLIEIAASKDQIDQFVWRPDGKRIVYSATVEGTYQIFEAPASGGAATQLSNGNTDFFVRDASVDGSRILFGSVNETSDLWSLDLQTSKETSVANDVASEFWPDLSPDGRSVAFQSVKQPDRPFGGSVLVKGQSDAALAIAAAGFSPVWSRDGNWVAYFRRSESGIDLWRVRPTGDDAGRIVTGIVQSLGYTATPYLKIGAQHIAWSPDSTRVAYASRAEGVSNIRIAAADGSNDAALTANRDAAEAFCCPIWSRDGKSIAFASEFASGTAKGAKIWIADVNGSARSIFDSKERLRLLGFSENGKELIYATRSEQTDRGTARESVAIFRLAIDSGKVGPVADIGSAYFHNIHLSPDGQTVAFVSRTDEATAIWIAALAAGKPKKVLEINDPKTLISSLAWAPDGKAIVYGRQTRTTLLSMLSE